MAPVFDDSSHGLRDVLSSLMDECDIDDASLSRETGVPASSISRMRLNAYANPTAATLRPIAKFFSISISQLLGDEPLPSDRLPGTHNPSGFISLNVPIIDWNFIVNWIDNDASNVQITHNKWVATEKDVGEKTFALTITTDSFGVAFRKGSLIIVDPERKPFDGDLVLLKKSEKKVVFLRQFLIDGDDVYIRSVNPEIKDTSLLDKNHRIIGVVIETRYSLQEYESSKTKGDEYKSEKSVENLFTKSLPKPV